jgi:hypothetical protein
MTTAKFLTIRQPWASLIAVGAKTIETRPFSTKYRGPLAIHAGKADRLPKAMTVGEWATLVEPLVATPLLDCVCGHALGDHAPEVGCLTCPCRKAMTSWPLGAVVAVCDLVDVVPIGHCVMDAAHVCHSGLGLLLHSDIARPWADGETEHDITRQEPFGDFTPGRYAWLLDNVHPIEPVPMKGAQGLRDVPGDVLDQIGTPA